MCEITSEYLKRVLIPSGDETANLLAWLVLVYVSGSLVYIVLAGTSWHNSCTNLDLGTRRTLKSASLGLYYLNNYLNYQVNLGPRPEKSYNFDPCKQMLIFLLEANCDWPGFGISKPGLVSKKNAAYLLHTDWNVPDQTTRKSFQLCAIKPILKLLSYHRPLQHRQAFCLMELITK